MHVWYSLEQLLIDDIVYQWLTCFRAFVCATGRHFEHTLWLSVFLCTWWPLFHTTLDAADNILWVHYKSMKCDVTFSQGGVSTLFRLRVRGHFSRVWKNFFLAYNGTKLIKIDRLLWSQMYCNLYPNHSVHVLQWTMVLSCCAAVCSNKHSAESQAKKLSFHRYFPALLML